LETLSLLTPLLLGLASTLHCIGMCGGIMGALTLSLPPAVRADRGALLGFVAAYNLGRIASYAVAGALMGGLGERLVREITPASGHRVLQATAALALIAVGLYLGGWLPALARVERLGTPLWRRLEPLGQRLLPVRGHGQALAFGAVWGWLPCGLVYFALLLSTASGGAVQGAAYMAAFGLGTLPGVMAAGVLMGWMTRWLRRPQTRRAIGAVVVAIALATLLVKPEYLHPGYRGGDICSPTYSHDDECD
jgi:sulfite exporter TauE/SafE